MCDSFNESLFTHFYQYAPQAAMSWSGVSSFKLLMTRVTPAGMCSGVSNILESGTIRHLTNSLESSHYHTPNVQYCSSLAIGIPRLRKSLC